MNKARKLLEKDVFKSHGYSIDKHIYLSPNDKKIILKHRKRQGGIQKDVLPGKEKKRRVTIYKHKDQYIGSVEHRLHSEHPKDVNYYLLKKEKNENMNRALSILARITESLGEEQEDLPLLEDSMNEKGRFSLRAYDPTTQKSLFKGHAGTPMEVKSMLSKAAKHLKDGGMSKIRISVHDHKHGMVSDHSLSKLPNGDVHLKGPEPENYFED